MSRWIVERKPGVGYCGGPTASTARAGLAIPGTLLALFVPIPVLCFTGVLASDIVYARTMEMRWANLSSGMLLVGVLFGMVAALAAAGDFLTSHWRRDSPAWRYGAGSTVVLALSVLNIIAHGRNPWTPVVPPSLTLSALTVTAMMATVIFGVPRAYRTSIGQIR